MKDILNIGDKFLAIGWPLKDVIAAMAQHNVIIGRVWPAMPSYARITVGTSDEMERFQQAFQAVMKG